MGKLQETLRVMCPNVKFLRKVVSRVKIATLNRHILPKSLVIQAENNPKKRKEIVEVYSSKWGKYMRKTERKIEDLVSRAPEYQNRADLDSLKEDMRFCRLAYGFLPEEYLCFDLENKSSTERREYVSDIERIKYDCMMSDMADSAVFKDKARTYQMFKKYYHRDAIAICNDTDLHIFKDFVKKYPKFVKKEVYASLGESVALVDMRTCAKNEDLLFSELIAKGKHILEELVIQSEAMAALNPSSVNTVRCITLLTMDGVEIPYCFIKIGQRGAFVDNGGAGGILVAINIKTGKLVNEGIDELNARYVAHPDTGVVFDGFQLPDWDNMLSICKEMAQMMPTVKYLGWDMAHTADGWVVIEGNNCGQMIGPQMTWKKGIKAEILRHMSNMDLLVRE